MCHRDSGAPAVRYCDVCQSRRASVTIPDGTLGDAPYDIDLLRGKAEKREQAEKEEKAEKEEQKTEEEEKA